MAFFFSNFSSLTWETAGFCLDSPSFTIALNSRKGAGQSKGSSFLFLLSQGSLSCAAWCPVSEDRCSVCSIQLCRSSGWGVCVCEPTLCCSVLTTSRSTPSPLNCISSGSYWVSFFSVTFSASSPSSHNQVPIKNSLSLLFYFFTSHQIFKNLDQCSIFSNSSDPMRSSHNVLDSSSSSDRFLLDSVSSVGPSAVFLFSVYGFLLL